MNKIMLAITLILAFGSLNAQDALMRAQKRAKYLNDYKALLQHDDPVMRMAALEEAMLGDDPQLRSINLANTVAVVLYEVLRQRREARQNHARIQT